ncbi:MAG: FHA domain-containing protein [Anaerolineae bacterium]|nr:FHA domain-containing protein [Anaerolineae bacterium]
MIAVQICPNCKRENRADALNCTYCGALLVDKAVETARVADFAALVRRPEAITPLVELRPGVLALYVMGEKDPILLEGQPTTTLGRVVFGEPAPTIDLTDYHGRLLGVSRHHATIHQVENGFSIEDLGSSNGTWLNDKRVEANQLTPVHSGDLIRLGQLVLMAHFQETGAAPSDSAADDKRKTRIPTRPLDIGTDVRALSLTLTGRPGRLDIRPDMVVTTMSHTPDADSLPEDAPLLFQVPRFYTVYIPIKLWKKVESALNDPHDQLMIEGTCAYDTENARIAILATHATSKHLEAKRDSRIARLYKRQQKSSNPGRRRRGAGR